MLSLFVAVISEFFSWLLANFLAKKIRLEFLGKLWFWCVKNKSIDYVTSETKRVNTYYMHNPFHFNNL